MATPALTAVQKVAVLLLSIDQELAASVLRKFPEEHLEKVARAMQDLRDVAIDQAAVDQLLKEGLERLRSGGLALGDVMKSMQDVLGKALGAEKGKAVAERLEAETMARHPFAAFDSISPDELASLLSEEHPQIVAVFLAHLGSDRSGKVISRFPEEKRAKILHRIATLDRAPADAIQRVLDVLRRKVQGLGLTSSRATPAEWVKVAADILNNMDTGGSSEVVTMIGALDRRIAEAIKDEMFTFDALATVEKRSMQKILAAVDTRNLALALKACESATEENVLANLSKRAREMIVEEKQTLGPVPLSDVLAAQKEIVKAALGLAEKGEIKIGRGPAEVMV
jgi:flagellar motor switch protein FliG